MIAGGSGITPMIQVLTEILENPDDKTEVSLLFSNRTEDDIIAKSQLDAAAAKYPNFKVKYVLSRPKDPSKWEEESGEKGHINADLIKKYIPAASDDTLIFVCGPPPFYVSISGDKDYSSSPPAQGVLDGTLKELGYDGKYQYIIFITIYYYSS